MKWNDFTEPEGVISGTFIAGLAAFFLRRLWLVFTRSEVELMASKAEMDVIDMLRKEVTRMGAINTELSKALTRLQRENRELKSEIGDLSNTIIRMSSQISDLEECVRKMKK